MEQSGQYKSGSRKPYSTPSHPHFTSRLDELAQRERWEIIDATFRLCYEEAFAHWWMTLTHLPIPLQAVTSDDFAAGYRFARQQIAQALSQDIDQETCQSTSSKTACWKYVDYLLTAEHKLALSQKTLDL